VLSLDYSFLGLKDSVGVLYVMVLLINNSRTLLLLNSDITHAQLVLLVRITVLNNIQCYLVTMFVVEMKLYSEIVI
jgi:hypothetical protein